MMRTGVIELFVDDQDRARVFYTDVLGLRVKTDAAYGGDGCWLTVVSPMDPMGTEPLLSPLNDAAAGLQAARRDTGSPEVVIGATAMIGRERVRLLALCASDCRSETPVAERALSGAVALSGASAQVVRVAP